MIGQALIFLRSQLDAYVRAEMEGGIEEPAADKVAFIDGDQMDPPAFKEEAVSQIVVNVREERQLRAADPYLRKLEDGRPGRAQPDIRLDLHVLFVARFKQYDSAWEHLGKVLEFMQSNRRIDRTSHPTLPKPFEQLTVELISLELHEQDNVWNALRTSYMPSLLYRVRLVVMRDVKVTASPQLTQPVQIAVRTMK